MRRIMALVALACVSSAFAADKSGYHLFNPTPREAIRELSTDRPDVTESPYTVDAGHFQAELSLVEYVYDDDGDATLREFAVLPSNLKVGLTNNIDLQLVFEPWIQQRIKTDDDETTSDGFGSTQLRLKLNLWGNDGGETALAVMPFVQFPTADDDIGGGDHVEGGVIVPLLISLPQDWSLALMGEIDVIHNDDDDNYGLSLLHTASVSRPIVGELSGYAEYVGVASRELDAGYIALVGGGFTYGLTENTQLDGGIYFGLSEAADDFTALLGISFRL